jgi:hypothetical protein
MKRYHYYLPIRPGFVIENAGGSMLGNCYSQSLYRVTSRVRLSKERLEALYKLGLIGMGQEFYVRSKCDGTEEPAIVDEVGCTTCDENGKPTGEPPINSYTGQPITGTVPITHYVYDCETRCDSGD